MLDRLLKDDYSVPFLELPKESQARIESLLISEYEKALWMIKSYKA